MRKQASRSQFRPRPGNPARLSILVACLWTAHAVAADDQAPLFSVAEPIGLRLEFPVRTLVNRAARRPEVDGIVEYSDTAGEPVRLDVEIRPRGNSRLEICRFPPLSLNFRRNQVEGTLFAGQNRIKLVTLCRDDEQHRQYLFLEELAYAIYAQVSEYGYRTRFADMTYVDTERDNRETVAPAFFIEHANSVAERTGMQAIDVPGVALEEHSPEALAVLTVYQFLIGNTDWSALASTSPDECCHNTDILVPAGTGPGVIAIPYDFDQTGLVDASYAESNARFRIRSVRQRVYRGFCSQNAYLAAAIERFVDERDEIELLIGQSRLNEAQREKALDYIRAGYEVLTDPAQLREEVLDECRE